MYRGNLAASYERWERYCHAETVQEALARGAIPGDIQYALDHGQATIRRDPESKWLERVALAEEHHFEFENWDPLGNQGQDGITNLEDEWWDADLLVDWEDKSPEDLTEADVAYYGEVLKDHMLMLEHDRSEVFHMSTMECADGAFVDPWGFGGIEMEPKQSFHVSPWEDTDLKAAVTLRDVLAVVKEETKKPALGHIEFTAPPIRMPEKKKYERKDAGIPKGLPRSEGIKVFIQKKLKEGEMRGVDPERIRSAKQKERASFAANHVFKQLVKKRQTTW